MDLGRTDIAHTSEGRHRNGQATTQVRDHLANLRAKLQKRAGKGTRSTRRRVRGLLQRLSGRERRFQSGVNPPISKSLVQTAKSNQAGIALEDLTGIRERINQQPRNQTSAGAVTVGRSTG
ncbi:MAG: hypothetical protein Q6L60_00205 [Thermostichus sp. HHBFW_bins_43]